MEARAREKQRKGNKNRNKNKEKQLKIKYARKLPKRRSDDPFVAINSKIFDHVDFVWLF